ncbi:hypothetical protein KIN20_025649 [Parelaphostrongylus tenuis]|uniref:Uncharacterized protein n=1 Tax=Parelaphostrongylus tenuis TaxID=148309 RepID=A0AAD5MVK8_PARTN|nr:hypothetical protein KIN20_025649 [Parelaphostrongylus tenuis]
MDCAGEKLGPIFKSERALSGRVMPPNMVTLDVSGALLIRIVGKRYFQKMNNFSCNYSARLRSRSKQPIYTSDKRAKFTQRENKKWIRFVTVLGYIFFVSLPAVSLSIYYVYLWDPGYIHKFQREVINYSVPIHKAHGSTFRSQRDIANIRASLITYTPAPVPIEQPCPPCKSNVVDLATILAEGSKSMESSSETIHGSSKESHPL